MYIGVDFGGTKTLLAVFSDDGELVNRVKFKTEGSYTEYLDKLVARLDELGSDYANADRIAIAVPAPLNYDHDTVWLETKMGLGWGEERFAADLAERTGKQILIENDGNVAALGEAVRGAGVKYDRVLYITLSTGIGTGYVENKRIDLSLRRSEGGFMITHNNGEWTPWEFVASGKAFTIKYGRMGSEVDDDDIWKEYSHDLAPGFINLMAIIQPEIVVVGGGMGAHLHKFQGHLEARIKELRPAHVRPVKIVNASIPDDAVIYGCYELAKQSHDDS